MILISIVLKQSDSSNPVFVSLLLVLFFFSPVVSLFTSTFQDIFVSSKTMFRSSSTTPLLIILVSIVTTIKAAGECANVTLTFCDNVQWQVNEEKRARADNIESMIQMSYYNQPGKWACKNEFKDLQCRVMFPQCSDMGGVGTNKAPCRTQCVDFLARCPGADIGCNDLSDDPKQCYNYNYDAGSVTGSTTSTYSKRCRSNVAVIIV